MEPYPLVAGIRYPASLTEFSHTEEPGNEPKVTISIGKTNREMFSALFNGMFAATVELPEDASAPIPPNVDLIIEPTLVDLEIASPDKSGSDEYTVWLNYNLLLTLPDRTSLGNWKVTAYGQDDTGSMGMGAEEAINDATMIALRDAAACIATEFEQAPGIATLLAAKSAPAATRVEPEVPESSDDLAE